MQKYIQDKKDQTYKGINMLEEKIIVSWQEGIGRIIKKIHPPLQEIKIPIKETQITASPFKIKLDPPKNINGRYPKNIIEQNNLTNQNLKIKGDQLVRTEGLIKNENEPIKSKDKTPYLFPIKYQRNLFHKLVNQTFLRKLKRG